LIRAALREDRAWEDAAGRALFSKEPAKGKIVFKGQRAVLCGEWAVKEAFRCLNSRVRVRFLAKEGALAARGAVVAQVKGRARAVLAGERTALNFLGLMSGIATRTREFVDAARRSRSSFCISDTRKTHPLLRGLEKYAVKVGGGSPHRMDLASLAMAKDNHLAVLRRVRGREWPRFLRASIRRWRRRGLESEVEVQSLAQLEAVAGCGPDWIMLDNMPLGALRAATVFLRQFDPRIKIEVSGGVTLEDIPYLARLPIDRVSAGAIVHSAPFADFSLELH